MRISAKGMVCGYPALFVRNLLRRSGGDFGVAFAQRTMGIDEAAASALLATLEADGYVEKVVEYGETWWRASVKGSALSMASAAPPMKRKAAQAVLVEFLRRVEQVRDDPRWCFKVDSGPFWQLPLGQPDARRY